MVLHALSRNFLIIKLCKNIVLTQRIDNSATNRGMLKNARGKDSTNEREEG